MYIPKFPDDLSAQRVGDRVDLRFTAPMRSTDHLPLRASSIRLDFCRQIEHGRCVPLPQDARSVQPSQPGSANIITISDQLPPELATGPERLIGYRIELYNPGGQSGGWSDPAYTVAGEAPAPVLGLSAEGSRLGVLLTWKAASAKDAEVFLERTDLTANPSSGSKRGALPKNVTRLKANGATSTLDTSAKPDTAYRYTAMRIAAVQLGGRTLELHSTPAPAATVMLRLVYPPLAPTGLTEAGFLTDATPTAPAGYAIDLNWQPVDDTGLLAGLAGYNVYREPVDATGRATARRDRLNATPLQVPAFHDPTALPAERYRYSVTAVDEKGNESAAATIVTVPDTQLPPPGTPPA